MNKSGIEASLLEVYASAPKSERFQRALKTILQHFDAQVGTLHHLDPKDGFLHLVADAGGIPEEILAVTRKIPVGKGMAGMAAQTGKPVSICNLADDTSGKAQPKAKDTGVQGALCVPVLSDGKVRGTLGIGSKGERTFTSEEVEALLQVGRSLAEHLST